MRRMFSRRSGKVAPYLLVAVLGGVVGGVSAKLLDRGGRLLSVSGPVRPYTEVVESGKPAALGEQVVQVVKKVGPAVVSIDTESQGPGESGFPFMPGERREGKGSGFIINGQEGLAVTNNHVVERAARIRVTLPDKRSFSAKVVGTDAIGDIALIRIEGGGNLPEIQFGDSDKLEIGQIVVAIGNPLGLESTVTQGVLSAIGRRLDEGHVQGIPLEDLLQTDAAINPGNSGGPLLDAYGRVIGMNTAIIATAQGIGFAVAANSIKRAVASILEHGRVIRSWIGISMVNMSPEVAEQLGVPPRDHGVVVAGVRRGEPADRAGLRRGDVITEANGQKVDDGEDVRRVIRDLKPGTRITLKGFRGDKPQTWQITVGEMPSPEQLGR
jgi:serine protease Do